MLEGMCIFALHQQHNTMFVHHVFFWMNPAATEAEKAQLHAGLSTLKSIDLIQTIHIGVPADTNRDVIDRSYNFSLLMLFASAAEEAQYQSHPTHLAFIDSCKHLWQKVQVYDAV